MYGIFLYSPRKKRILQHTQKNLWSLAYLLEAGRGGVVLDPFFGSGTTGRVAIKHGRGYIGIELNPKYIEIEKKRLDGVQTVLF